MMHSMTAFAQAERQIDPYFVATTMRSYNHRYLDVALKISPPYRVLEEKIISAVSEELTRGRVEIVVQVRDASPAAAAFRVDMNRAAAYHDALERLKKRFAVDSPVPLALMAGLEGVIKPADINPDMEACWQVIGACVRQALVDLIAMRKQEGKALERDLSRRIDIIQGHMHEIEKASHGLVDHYRQRLMERIATLTRGRVNLEPERVAQEAAFLADKSDISEELVRVESHIQQFREILTAAAPAGRKLNFMVQELNREFNTIGSKTTAASVSHRVIEVKTELEKIREQVQNVA